MHVVGWTILDGCQVLLSCCRREGSGEQRARFGGKEDDRTSRQGIVLFSSLDRLGILPACMSDRWAAAALSFATRERILRRKTGDGFLELFGRRAPRFRSSSDEICCQRPAHSGN